MAKKQKQQAPEGWQDVVDASDELEGTGVEHDGAGPQLLVKLSEDEHRQVGDELTKTLRAIERVKAEKKATAKEFKDEIEDLELRRDTLRDEWDSGNRKIEPPVITAQETLPGVDAEPS